MYPQQENILLYPVICYSSPTTNAQDDIVCQALFLGGHLKGYLIGSE